MESGAFGRADFRGAAGAAMGSLDRTIVRQWLAIEALKAPVQCLG